MLLNLENCYLDSQNCSFTH